MADITITRNKTLPDTSAKSDVHDLVDLATASISNIVGSDLSQIVTDNKIGGSSLYGLQSITSGASIPNTALEPLTDGNLVSGSSLYNLASGASTAGTLPYWNVVASLASGSTLSYDGITSLVGAASGLNVKVGSFTRDMTAATGTQAVTGVGFTPKLLIFFATIGGTVASSWGATDGTTDIRVNRDSAGANFASSATQCVVLETAGSTGQTATFSSFDADGFTLSWTKNASPTGTGDVYYIAFK